MGKLKPKATLLRLYHLLTINQNKIIMKKILFAAAVSALKDGQKLKTVQGGDLMVSVKDGKVMINGANVTIANVVSSNGVTHVIDAVVMNKK